MQQAPLSEGSREPRSPSLSALLPVSAGGASEATTGPDRTLEKLVAALMVTTRSIPGGFFSWCAMAMLAHAMLFGWAWTGAALRDMFDVVASMRDAQRAFFEDEYEIAIDPVAPPKPPEPEPPPEPEAPPEPEPEPVAVAVPRDQAPAEPTDPYDPPPAAAEAGKVLTAGDDDEPLDMTGDGFVSGQGTGPGYGMVAADGTAKAPTYNPNAVVGGTPGGTGKGPPQAPPPPAGPDRSRAPGLSGGGSWGGCPFPAEADADQIDQANAVLVVTVRPDGSPLSVRVTSDPGHGFGRQARLCALGKRYSPGLDRDGNPITSVTPPITVRFVR